MKAKKEKVFAFAKGFWGRRKNCWTLAARAVDRAFQVAYTGRKLKKREFRARWIGQINAGVRAHGLNYSAFVRLAPAAGIVMNRKVLANLAATEPYTFKAVVEMARAKGVELGTLRPLPTLGGALGEGGEAGGAGQGGTVAKGPRRAAELK
jgi:large subunit ribosomal protein L20